MNWTAVDLHSVPRLREARPTLHWALQVPAAASANLAEPRADFSHTTFQWDDAQSALVGIELPSGLRTGLRFSDLTLIVVRNGELRAQRGLVGLTLDEALSWLAHAVGAESLQRLKHDLPEHPVAGGARFELPDSRLLSELERWYSSTANALGPFASLASAGAIRCWPHHFDMATLLVIDSEGGEDARSIGVGLSPGDGSYDEPYLYVMPWPYPKPETKPTLDVGYWHENGWSGFALTATELLREGNPEGRVASYYRQATEIAYTLLGAPTPNLPGEHR